MATKTTVIIPDIQLPFHDKIALNKIVKVIREEQPHQIVQIGDGIDFKEVSQWTKGTAEEYAPTLQKNVDEYKGFLSELQDAAPKAKKVWLEGNHDKRLMDFIHKYAAPLRTLEALSMSSLFELDTYGVEYVKGPYRIATNTFAIHGHESAGYASAASAWDTKFAKRYGSHRNFVFGHTHQPFIITRAYGYDGNVTPRFTMNVGSVMDPVEATYVKDGAVSWQMAFGVLRDDGKRVYPELISMVDRGFFYQGKKY